MSASASAAPSLPTHLHPLPGRLSAAATRSSTCPLLRLMTTSPSGAPCAKSRRLYACEQRKRARHERIPNAPLASTAALVRCDCPARVGLDGTMSGQVEFRPGVFARIGERYTDHDGHQWKLVKRPWPRWVRDCDHEGWDSGTECLFNDFPDELLTFHCEGRRRHE